MSWTGNLSATHFWDCNGGGCDAPILQPWDESLYSYHPFYAPLDPEEHGGSLYGESMWLTGAASSDLGRLLGADAACCGHDVNDGAGVGGCGKCILVRAPSSANPELKALIMKKNHCPADDGSGAGNPLCDTGKLHIDVAVPGFDFAAASTANVCGSGSRTQTHITAAQSYSCGSWWTSGPDTRSCDCSALPDDTPERAQLKSGCLRFADWGWRSGSTNLEFQLVACPPNFADLIGSAFTATGGAPLAASPLAPAPQPSASLTPSPPALDSSCGAVCVGGILGGGLGGVVGLLLLSRLCRVIRVRLPGKAKAAAAASGDGHGDGGIAVSAVRAITIDSA